MDDLRQLLIADLLPVVVLYVIKNRVQALQPFLSLAALGFRENLLGILPNQVGDEPQQLPPADKMIPYFPLQIFPVNNRHDAVNHFILFYQPLKNNVLARKLLGKILHLKDDHHHPHKAPVAVARMELVAVDYHQAALLGLDLSLVQAQQRRPLQHIMQLYMLMPMSQEILAFFTVLVHMQLHRKLRIAQILLFIKPMGLHAAAPPPD